MSKIDRSNPEHAKTFIESCFPDPEKRNVFAQFILEAIEYAQTINPGKWNLNLDKEGKFLRFNSGKVYCIELRPNSLLVVCNRESLKKNQALKKLSVSYVGYENNLLTQAQNPDELDDLLLSIPGSLGVVLTNEQVDILPSLKEANDCLIRASVHRPHTNNMKNAHSLGVLEYLQSLNNTSNTKSYSFEDIQSLEKERLRDASSLSSAERLARISLMNPKPEKIQVVQTIYSRNQYIVAEVLARANGICERCKQPAPFMRSSNNSPYLEVHHTIPLSVGGEDTLENTEALCPNCHRKAHFG